MALASVVPILWGTLTDKHVAAGWMALAAQAICWVELKSGYGGRLRILLGGIVLAVASTALGSLVGSYFLPSVLAMLGVGFAAGMFKNLGDRGAGLSISLYVLFIISAAWPTEDLPALTERLQRISIGGAWNAVVGMGAVAISGERSPARRAIAGIWRTSAELFRTVGRGWDGKAPRASLRTLYQNETAVRSAIDAALAHDAITANKTLTSVRRSASLVGALAASCGESLAAVRRQEVPVGSRRRLSRMAKALADMSETFGLATATLRTPDATLVAAIDLARDELDGLQKAGMESAGLRRAVQLAERSLRLADGVRASLTALGSERPFYRSPSVLRLVVALHPRHWWSGVRLLFSSSASTLRYAGRIAAVSALAMAVYRGFDIPRGYWLPLTVIVVAQPYFGATIKKARERVIGTVVGGAIGGALMLLPTGIFLREAALVISSFLMVFYARKNYSIATVFITLTLVLVLSVTDEATPTTLLIRAAVTAAGAILAVAAGFLLLPTWDRTALPRHMAAAFIGVYDYFVSTFYRSAGEPWTAAKRRAERASATAFDSLSRYLSEPGATRRTAGAHFGTLAHIVRVTHELNALHLEGTLRTAEVPASVFSEAVQKNLRTLNEVFFLLRQKTGFTEGTPVPLEAQVLCEGGSDALLTLEHIADELKALEYDVKEPSLADSPS